MGSQNGPKNGDRKVHFFPIFCARALKILSSRCEIFRRRRHFCARWHLHVGLRVKTNRAVLRTFGTPEHGHGRAHSVTKSSDVGKEPVARVCTCNHARSCDSARKSTAAWRQVTHAWVGGRRRFVATAFFRRARCLPAAASGFVPKRSRTISAFSCSGLRTADPEGCCRCSLDLSATAYCTPKEVAAFVRAPSRPAHCVLVRLERLRRQSSHMHCCGVIIAPVHKECPRHIASRSWLLLRHQTLAAGKAAR